MINKELVVKKSVDVNAKPSVIWKILTDPLMIREYIFGTEVKCDWHQGSEIIFAGEWQGHPYRDKGIIIGIIPEQLLSYDYWSAFSGLEDKRENYSLVTYQLSELDAMTCLKVEQAGFANEDGFNHADEAWPRVLEKIKALAEGMDQK